MPKFRKKPVVVEAEQWFPGKDVPGVKVDDIVLPDGTRLREWAYVTTTHGQVTVVAAGDWIIAEPDGNGHYPCKPDIFEATYESV